jgi:hypothetical protein
MAIFRVGPRTCTAIQKALAPMKSSSCQHQQAISQNIYTTFAEVRVQSFLQNSDSLHLPRTLLTVAHSTCMIHAKKLQKNGKNVSVYRATTYLQPTMSPRMSFQCGSHHVSGNYHGLPLHLHQCCVSSSLKNGGAPNKLHIKDTRNYLRLQRRQTSQRTSSISSCIPLLHIIAAPMLCCQLHAMKHQHKKPAAIAVSSSYACTDNNVNSSRHYPSPKS